MMLHVRQIGFDYDYEPVLEHVSFDMDSGDLLLLQGKNGSGKTTLLKLLAGLLMPGTGDIIWQGASIYSKLRAYQPEICYVGHKPGINPALTVWENCQFDKHWARKVCKDKDEDSLQQFDLLDIRDKRCSTLSQGQQKRVSLCRLAMSKEKLWLLDEPLTAIDDLTQLHVMDLIEHHTQCGGMVIMTSHQSLPKPVSFCKEYRIC